MSTLNSWVNMQKQSHHAKYTHTISYTSWLMFCFPTSSFKQSPLDLICSHASTTIHQDGTTHNKPSALCPLSTKKLNNDDPWKSANYGFHLSLLPENFRLFYRFLEPNGAELLWGGIFQPTVFNVTLRVFEATQLKNMDENHLPRG